MSQQDLDIPRCRGQLLEVLYTRWRLSRLCAFLAAGESFLVPSDELADPRGHG